jgi:RHS repeat-associated protein
LSEEKLDHVNTNYRRARSYDPVTGHFTQEDPIGLAGGLNAYGFAGGDPINYSDPFGLCPPQDSNIWTCQGTFTFIGALTGALVGGGIGGSGGAAACSPTVVGAIPCGAGGAALGAVKGAALGAAVGTLVDAGIHYFSGRSDGDDAKPERQPGETANFNHAVRELGLDKNEASETLHQIKKAAGLRGNDNVWIHTETGDVRAQATGEIIGNLLP